MKSPKVQPKVRMDAPLHKQLMAAAKKAKRSFNQEVCERLRQSFALEEFEDRLNERESALLNAVVDKFIAAVKPKGK